jgi:pimeloyl-ACP methyl ester carboxylesterase
MEQPPLILLAGMGADERVFTPQFEAFPNLIVPRWIAPIPNETLRDYAARFARQIDPGVPCYIGGASFGGFVAIEMARHLKTQGCFLIGSVRSPAELPLRIRLMRTLDGATGLLPFGAASRIAGFGLRSFLLPCSGPTTRAVLAQVSDADADFMRWATRAVLRWDTSNELSDAPVWQIHGTRDRVLPIRRTRPDMIIDGGGHVLTLSHPREVNAFLKRSMQSAQSVESR